MTSDGRGGKDRHSGCAIEIRLTIKESFMHIFVGNLAWGTTEEDLAQLFHLYGEIVSVRILLERGTNRSRGFGFVEMPDAMEGNAAIADLNGTLLGGRPLTVNEARQREERDGPRREPRRPRDERRPRW
jgi:cold-inducible RNA-binding protein